MESQTKGKKLRKFWTYVRIAQARYFNMIFWFFTFPGVFYGLILEELPRLKGIFPNFVVFFLVFAPTYLLVSAWAGDKEFKKGSILEEIKLMGRLNPVNQLIMDCFSLQAEAIRSMVLGDDAKSIENIEKIQSITEDWLEVLS